MTSKKAGRMIGQRITIVGTTGSGKTTLVRELAKSTRATREWLLSLKSDPA
jgi:nicotinamide riboside kinase